MSGIFKIYTRLTPLLSPLGRLYGWLMQLRRGMYRRGVLASCRPVPLTVSVGNISWGGTGKTPVVAWLLGWAARKKLKVAVLSRGYKGKPPRLRFLVEAQGSPLESGDEPLMLAKLFPGASVLVDPVRSRAVRFAEKTLSPGLFVLDDGFQHLGVSRDLNILLLTPDDLGAGWNRVIPGGTWRENSGALADADVILLRLESGCTQDAFEELCAEARGKLGRLPLFPFFLENTGLRRLGGNETVPGLGGAPYNLFCGVGRPQDVLLGATGLLGEAPRRFAAFDDHHEFLKEEILALCEDGLNLVCTEKDAVKLEFYFPDILSNRPIWAMQASVRFLPGCEGEAYGMDFEQWWEAFWGQAESAREPVERL